MRRYLLLLSCLFLVICNCVQIVNAISKDYEWEVGAGYSRHRVSVTTQESWQTDVSYNVTVRLTLIFKHWTLDRAETKWMKVVLTSSKFTIESTQEETVIIREEGDYWERTFSLKVPSNLVNRGEFIATSLVWIVSIDDIDNQRWSRWDHTGNSYSDPMIITVHRPFLSTIEIAIILPTIIVVGSVLYVKRKEVKSRLTKPKVSLSFITRKTTFVLGEDVKGTIHIKSEEEIQVNEIKIRFRCVARERGKTTELYSVDPKIAGDLHLTSGQKEDFLFEINIPVGAQESHYSVDSSMRWFLEAFLDIKGRRNVTSIPYEVQVVKQKEAVRKGRIRCQYCGALNLDTASHCSYCGAKI